MTSSTKPLNNSVNLMPLTSQQTRPRPLPQRDMSEPRTRSTTGCTTTATAITPTPKSSPPANYFLVGGGWIIRSRQGRRRRSGRWPMSRRERRTDQFSNQPGILRFACVLAECGVLRECVLRSVVRALGTRQTSGQPLRACATGRLLDRSANSSSASRVH